MIGFGVLSRYLVRQNLYLMAICLMVGTCIYLLSEVSDRIDDFVSAGLGVKSILFYFIAKIPLIISQLLPAIFLITLIVQFGILNRNREMLALRAGGVSFGWFVRFFILYALIWSGAQLVFSQYLGVFGETEANRIWKEDVRKKQLENVSIKKLWFRDGPYIVLANEAFPSKSRAKNVTIYEFSDTQDLIRIFTAKNAFIDDKGWGLLDVNALETHSFQSREHQSLFLPIHQNLHAYASSESNGNKSQLPLWELGKAIDVLEQSGSNVEILKTAWHGKLSYAFSLVIMTLVALALSTFSENVYANIAYSLLCIFIQYGLHVVGTTAGEKGVLSPLFAAWLGNIIMGSLASLRLLWVGMPGVQRQGRNCFKSVCNKVKKASRA